MICEVLHLFRLTADELTGEKFNKYNTDMMIHPSSALGEPQWSPEVTGSSFLISFFSLIDVEEVHTSFNWSSGCELCSQSDLRNIWKLSVWKWVVELERVPLEVLGCDESVLLMISLHIKVKASDHHIFSTCEMFWSSLETCLIKVC